MFIYYIKYKVENIINIKKDTIIKKEDINIKKRDIYIYSLKMLVLFSVSLFIKLN